jgi:hypothetical protein
MNKNNTTINKICTDCIHVKVNSKGKFKNPGLHCTKRSNCKLIGKEEAKWCDLYKEGK